MSIYIYIYICEHVSLGNIKNITIKLEPTEQGVMAILEPLWISRSKWSNGLIEMGYWPTSAELELMHYIGGLSPKNLTYVRHLG